MYPPHVVPPGVHPSADGADVAAPVSLVEWFLNFYEEAKEAKVSTGAALCVRVHVHVLQG